MSSSCEIVCSYILKVKQNAITIVKSHPSLEHPVYAVHANTDCFIGFQSNKGIYIPFVSVKVLISLGPEVKPTRDRLPQT